MRALDRGNELFYDIHRYRPSVCFIKNFMPWTKENKTKQNLIRCALDLFYKKGYEKTSIEDIVVKAKVSKGAFFHYFKTKEDIMNAIAEKYSEEVASIMAKVADNPNMNAAEKMNRIITEGAKHKMVHSAEYQKVGMILYDHKNYLLHHRILQTMREITLPPIQKIIEQGMKEGIFKVEFAPETAETFLYSLFMMRESVMPVVTGEKKVDNFEDFVIRKLKFSENLINRILGAEPRTVKLPRINKTLIKFMKLFMK